MFDNSIDENVHLQFQKFGKGEFKDKAVIKAKQSKGKYTINTSYEFANELVKAMAKKLSDGKTKVTGGIISTSDLKGELEFKEIKRFQGIKRYMLDKEMSGDEIINLLEKFPKAFFALSFNVNDDVLKIKPKLPKSGKSSNKSGEKSKPDFCKLITNNETIGKSFVFERPDFKTADINHTFIINEIIIPDEFEKEKDYARVREMAKRKGKIIREALIDGQKIKSEKEFVA